MVYVKTVDVNNKVLYVYFGLRFLFLIAAISKELLIRFFFRGAPALCIAMRGKCTFSWRARIYLLKKNMERQLCPYFYTDDVVIFFELVQANNLKSFSKELDC